MKKASVFPVIQNRNPHLKKKWYRIFIGFQILESQYKFNRRTDDNEFNKEKKIFGIKKLNSEGKKQGKSGYEESYKQSIEENEDKEIRYEPTHNISFSEGNNSYLNNFGNNENYENELNSDKIPTKNQKMKNNENNNKIMENNLKQLN